MELAQIRAFVAVARKGGFAVAAKALDIAPSSATRAVAALEASLGVRLFQRTTRRVNLTEAGEALLERVAPALEEIEAAFEKAKAGGGEPSGVLRVSASVSYGQIVVVPTLASFRERYPGISLELALTDAVVDLVADRIDVALRHGRLQDSSFIAQRLHGVEYWLVASPGYLEGRPRIRSPKDIARHAQLSFPYAAFSARWRFQRADAAVNVAIDPILRVSNAVALAECARAGLGIALLADWTVASDVADGRLKRILPGWRASGDVEPAHAAVSIITPSRAYVPAATRAFVDHLRSHHGGRRSVS